MANEVYSENNKDWSFTCTGCWRTEPRKGDDYFNNEKEAKIALQLHKIGCKKS